MNSSLDLITACYGQQANISESVRAWAFVLESPHWLQSIIKSAAKLVRSCCCFILVAAAAWPEDEQSMSQQQFLSSPTAAATTIAMWNNNYHHQHFISIVFVGFKLIIEKPKNETQYVFSWQSIKEISPCSRMEALDLVVFYELISGQLEV